MMLWGMRDSCPEDGAPMAYYARDMPGKTPGGRPSNPVQGGAIS